MTVRRPRARENVCRIDIGHADRWKVGRCRAGMWSAGRPIFGICKGCDRFAEGDLGVGATRGLRSRSAP
jgi:hypothetical protein